MRFGATEGEDVGRVIGAGDEGSPEGNVDDAGEDAGKCKGCRDEVDVEAKTETEAREDSKGGE